MSASRDPPVPAGTDAPPRVILVVPDQWTRALARAALREIGYDAVGALDLRQALQQWSAAPERGAVRAVIVDHDAAAPAGVEELQRFHAALGAPPMVLVRRPTRAEPPGPWSLVLPRPVSMADLTEAVRCVWPLSPQNEHPLDLPDADRQD